MLEALLRLRLQHTKQKRVKKGRVILAAMRSCLKTARQQNPERVIERA